MKKLIFFLVLGFTFNGFSAWAQEMPSTDKGSRPWYANRNSTDTLQLYTITVHNTTNYHLKSLHVNSIYLGDIPSGTFKTFNVKGLIHVQSGVPFGEVDAQINSKHNRAAIGYCGMGIFDLKGGTYTYQIEATEKDDQVYLQWSLYP